MKPFDPRAYGPLFAPLLDVDRNRELGPGTPNEAALGELQSLTPETALAHARLVDRQMGQLCLAGVWLLHDFLDESHHISAQVSTVEGSYWHGVMHRREQDFTNSKYWFNRTGDHPIFDPLNEAAHALAAGRPLDEPAELLAIEKTWDPFVFVDVCETIAQGETEAEPIARQVAQREWELLFDYCYQAALGR